MILRNAIFRWLGLAAEVGVSLVLTPLLVRHLGQAAYGVWLLIMSTVGIFAFADMGLASAVTKNLAADLARGDRASAWLTAASSLTMYIGIALVVLACYLGLAWWAGPVFNLGPESLAPARVVLMALGLCTALSFFSNLFEGMLLAREQHHLVGLVETFVALARLAALYTALKLWGGLMSVGLAYTLVTVGGYLALYLLSQRRIPLGRRLRPSWERRRARSLLAYGRDSLLISLGMRMRQEGPVLLTGALAGPLAVPFLGIGLRLINYQVALVQQASGVAQARFSALEATQGRRAVQELLLRSSLYSCLLTAYLALCTVFLAKPFILLWLGPNFLESVKVIEVLLAPLGMYMALRPCEVLLWGIGRHRVNGLVCLGEAAVMAGLCLLLVGRWQHLGAAFSLGAAMLLFRPWVIPAYTCRQVELGLGRYWRQGPLRAALAGALAALPLGLIFRYWQVASWLELVAGGAVVTLVCGACFWLAGLDASERSFWWAKLAQVRIRGRGGA